MAGPDSAGKNGRQFPHREPVFVTRVDSFGRPVTPEDVWNAAIRAGADPARLALSLSHVLGEVTYEEMVAGREDEPALVRYTLTTGEVVEYDAGFHNPFKSRPPGH